MQSKAQRLEGAENGSELPETRLGDLRSKRPKSQVLPGYKANKAADQPSQQLIAPPPDTV
jgi:hypothetical protein